MKDAFRSIWTKVVQATIEETLNALLEAEADRLCGARKCNLLHEF
jgi:hypothetical protein